MRTTLITLALASLLTLVGCGTKITVHNADSGVPLEGARVRVQSDMHDEQIRYTGFDGAAWIELPEGPVTLLVSAPNHQSQSRTLSGDREEIERMRFDLTPIRPNPANSPEPIEIRDGGAP
jgi:uncharacterized protein YceK